MAQQKQYSKNLPYAIALTIPDSKGYHGVGLNAIDPGAKDQSWMKMTLSKRPD